MKSQRPLRPGENDRVDVAPACDYPTDVIPACDYRADVVPARDNPTCADAKSVSPVSDDRIETARPYDYLLGVSPARDDPKCSDARSVSPASEDRMETARPFDWIGFLISSWILQCIIAVRSRVLSRTPRCLSLSVLDRGGCGNAILRKWRLQSGRASSGSGKLVWSWSVSRQTWIASA